MKRRFTEKQIIGIRREQEAALLVLPPPSAQAKGHFLADPLFGLRVLHPLHAAWLKGLAVGIGLGGPDLVVDGLQDYLATTCFGGREHGCLGLVG